MIACHRAGVTQALASLGTSLAEDHAKLLARWSDEVVILYDSDAAGQKAAARAVGILQPEAVRVRVALMPAGDDPDTLLNRDGPAGVLAAVRGALLPLDFQIQAIEARLSPQSDEFWVEAVEALADAENHLELDKHLVRLASQYPGFHDPRAAQTALRKQVALVRRTKKAALNQKLVKPVEGTVMATLPILTPLFSAEVVLLAAFLSQELREIAWPYVCQPDLFVTERGANLSRAISEAFHGEIPDGPVPDWLFRIESEAVQEQVGDVLTHFHGQNVNQDVLLAAIDRLRQERQTPRFSRLAEQSEDPEAKNNFFLKLRQIKPDHREIAGPKDSLF